MKSVILKGVEVKIGDSVRFIDDRNLYPGMDINLPELGEVYEVAGFSVGNNGKPGFYLKEITNDEIAWSDESGDVEWDVPGFAIWRFEPATPLADAISEIDTKKVQEVFEKLLDKTVQQHQRN